MFFLCFFLSGEDDRPFLVCRAVCVQETATLLEGAQLSANRFYCSGITDNPGRFDIKSTQVTQAPRRTDERGGREKETRQRDRQATGNKGSRGEGNCRRKKYVKGNIEKKTQRDVEDEMYHWLSK